MHWITSILVLSTYGCTGFIAEGSVIYMLILNLRHTHIQLATSPEHFHHIVCNYFK
jgi:hypothetical protein